MKKVLLLILLILNTYCLVYATGQEPDILLYQGSTLRLYSNPLEGWLDKLPQRPKEFESRSSACWRGYIATWLLENNQLYLTAIRPGCASEGPNIPLNRWFKPDARGRVAATWVDGNLDVPLGELLNYEHMGYESIYEKDWLLLFRHGRLVSQRMYKNQVSKPLDKDFSAQLYRALDWKSIPTQSTAACRMHIEFSPDSTGKHSRVLIRKGCGNPYDAVALHAAQQIAVRDWGATYRFGRWVPMKWHASVVFSEENRRKYSRY
ncbi:hypothetical protein H8B15_14900 [Hymenobacter sp. BT507]|uniref:TonB C-terminal domain-containing protein n=1 Tax=Hymenobacter citatus TaxID=2763506 RepID=A0ABR7MMB2_9BACT|nr:hypothetical protein [Hymenobacter citatus]MBC6612215.1 hypothetical protein [Hymenobacter citatus]